MLMNDILGACDERYKSRTLGKKCGSCSYKEYCPEDCERCLDFIHNPGHAPEGAPKRKYDCTNMADFYTCKYSCRYTSEMIYALRRFKSIKQREAIKVLSFGCGPCTDLFALDYLRESGEWEYDQLEYRGVDYSKDVWRKTHTDIRNMKSDGIKVKFFYEDMCDFIETIGEGAWIPDLVIFQYVLSDMRKHSRSRVSKFISAFADFANTHMPSRSYIVLNDANFGKDYGGGREYFDDLFAILDEFTSRKGRFYNENSRGYYQRGYPYGEDSDGEFPENRVFFNLSPWNRYSPFRTCASAQMLIVKR